MVLAPLCLALALAPPPALAAPPPGGAVASPGEPAGFVVPTPVLIERELAGGFVLRREEFLQWVVVPHAVYGLTVQPRYTQRLTLGFTRPLLQPIELSLEGIAGGPQTMGMWSARIAVKVPRTETSVFIQRTGVASYSSAGPSLSSAPPGRRLTLGLLRRF
ncbi:MAG: hypothetical protein H6710_16255 [Myxococcales bacterium]|nr:hypothetical protein [Myxococcales bacterium]